MQVTLTGAHLSSTGGLSIRPFLRRLCSLRIEGWVNLRRPVRTGAWDVDLENDESLPLAVQLLSSLGGAGSRRLQAAGSGCLLSLRRLGPTPSAADNPCGVAHD